MALPRGLTSGRDAPTHALRARAVSATGSSTTGIIANADVGADQRVVVLSIDIVANAATTLQLQTITGNSALLPAIPIAGAGHFHIEGPFVAADLGEGVEVVETAGNAAIVSISFVVSSEASP